MGEGKDGMMDRKYCRFAREKVSNRNRKGVSTFRKGDQQGLRAAMHVGGRQWGEK
jgi:hypothetical protein